MSKSNDASPLPLNSDAHALAKPLADKPRASRPLSAYTCEQWIQGLPEACKRLDSDEAYRKEVAKRQF